MARPRNLTGASELIDRVYEALTIKSIGTIKFNPIKAIMYTDDDFHKGIRNYYNEYLEARMINEGNKNFTISMGNGYKKDLLIIELVKNKNGIENISGLEERIKNNYGFKNSLFFLDGNTLHNANNKWLDAIKELYINYDIKDYTFFPSEITKSDMNQFNTHDVKIISNQVKKLMTNGKSLQSKIDQINKDESNRKINYFEAELKKCQLLDLDFKYDDGFSFLGSIPQLLITRGY